MKRASFSVAVIASFGPDIYVHMLMNALDNCSRNHRLSLFLLYVDARFFLSFLLVLASALTGAARAQTDAVQLENFDEYPQLAFPSRWKPHGDQS